MSRAWVPVTRSRRCMVCDGASWCAVSGDGRVRKCMRNHYEPDAFLREDKITGSLAAYYFDDVVPREQRRAPPVTIVAPVAPVETLDVVYRTWLRMMSLSDAHRADLRRRGLSDEQIDAGGYRTGKAGLERALIGQFPPETLALIPGLYVTARKVAAVHIDGLWIPVRDTQARIIAIKVRRDNVEDGKYRWLSSTSKDGAGPGSPPHAPVFGDPSPSVRVIEGELKADVCSAKTALYSLAIPGATMAGAALPVLKTMQATRVALAWDADVVKDYGLDERGQQKRNYVASGLEHAMHLYASEGYDCAVEHWSAAAGKGLDDVLAGPSSDLVVTYTGQAAWDRVVDNLISAKTVARPDTLERCSSEALERYQAAQAPPPPPVPDTVDAWITEALESAPFDPGGLDAALAGAADIPVPGAQAPVAPKAKKAVKTGGAGGKPPKAPAGFSPGGGNRRTTDFERGDEVELARRLLTDLRDGSSEPILFDRNKFWRFEPKDGLWHALIKVAVEAKVMSYAGMTYAEDDGDPKVLNLSWKKIESTVKAAQSIATETMTGLDPSELFFDNAPRGIATQGEFLELLDDGTLRVEPLRAEHRQTVCLPFKWDANATAPTWERFYADVFSICDPKEAASRAENLDEMVGACLFGIATRYQKCFVLLGDGNNGKGTWLKVIRRLFPAEYVCAQAPQALIRNQFSLASIVGKRVNLVGEMPVQKFIESATIKSLIAGDEMETEKKRVDSFKFVPQAGHIFLANLLSDTADTTHGWMRRFVIIGFDRIFSGAEIIPDLDVNLAAELPGIFARVVAAVQRLVARKKFLEPGSSAESLEEWKYQSDPVYAFVQDCCVRDPSAETTLAELHTAYVRWTEQSRQRVIPANTFGGNLKKLGFKTRDPKHRFYLLRIDPEGMAGTLARTQNVPPKTTRPS